MANVRDRQKATHDYVKARLHYYEAIDDLFCVFFFNDTATTEIYTVPYTLSLHDALPIFRAPVHRVEARHPLDPAGRERSEEHTSELQSHGTISYAVFCLKKKTQDTC